ncbi:MAG: hypothetical protein EBU33_07370, partial [Sphingobacteriia bacterium]|nr:hypothetical protein [Sphingobacteriia bacterium]
SSNQASEIAKEEEKMYKNYSDAKAKGKFKSTSPIANSKQIQENINSLIENSEYKDAYKALNPSKIEDAGAIKAVNEYFFELYKYNTTPNISNKPYPGDYFDNYNGKIIAVQ